MTRVTVPSASREPPVGNAWRPAARHLAAKRLIADLLGMSPGESNFDAKVKVLKDVIEHHVEEEESDLFGKAKKELGDGALETMGVEMQELFEALLPTEPRFELEGETGEAAPLE